MGTPTVHSDTSTDGGHGRVEVRTVHVTTDIGYFADRAEWKGLESVVMVESERHLGAKVQRLRRYFLCSLATTDAAAVGAYVRDHWSIEHPLQSRVGRRDPACAQGSLDYPRAREPKWRGVARVLRLVAVVPKPTATPR